MGQDIHGVGDDRMGAPGVDWIVRAEVAVCGGQGFHSGGLAGCDVTDVVADVEAACGLDASTGAGVQQRVGKGLGPGGSVTAHDAGAASAETEGVDDWVRQALGLVRDHAPGDAPLVQTVEERLHALEEPGLDAQGVVIKLEKARGQWRVSGSVGRQAEAHAQHATNAMGDLGAQQLEGRGLEAVLAAGQKKKVIKPGIDPLQLYISIAALSYFYLSNNDTLSTIFVRDLSTPKAKVERLQHMIDLVLGYLMLSS